MEPFRFSTPMSCLGVSKTGRTLLSPERLSETKRLHIGKVLIFCEGNSEKYYFDYFAQILNTNKYTELEVVLESADGNARTVLNYANRFFENEENSRKYAFFEKYLAFDCDDPPNIQSVIQDAASYHLLVSNYLFETWLLMHFEDIDSRITKAETYRRLTSHLRNTYEKGSQGKTREIIQNGSVEKAIRHAAALKKRYAERGKTVFANIADMNPYTSVYELVEQFMAEISL